MEGGHAFTFTFHFHALEKEMATHSSVLAWRIPETGEPGGLPSMGSHSVGKNIAQASSLASILLVCLPQLPTLVTWLTKAQLTDRLASEFVAR